MIVTDVISDDIKAVEIIIALLSMFLIGCMIGYLFEVLFRRFISAKKWINPGFMKGPWLPLYGFGLVLMFLLTFVVTKFMPKYLHFYNPLGNLYGNTYKIGPNISDLIPLLILGVGMTLLEFIAGLIFVKGFKVRLWDYSNMRGNIMGIICPVFSIIWFIVSIIYYYLINPFAYQGFITGYRYLFGSVESSQAAHFGTIFILGIAYGILIIDLCKSLGLFTKIVRITKESKIIDKYEKLRDDYKKKVTIARAELIDKIPENEKVKKRVEKAKNSANKFIRFVKKIVLIDPEKKKEDNYDKDGRPLKNE